MVNELRNDAGVRKERVIGQKRIAWNYILSKVLSKFYEVKLDHHEGCRLALTWAQVDKRGQLTNTNARWKASVELLFL